MATTLLCILVVRSPSLSFSLAVACRGCHGCQAPSRSTAAGMAPAHGTLLQRRRKKLDPRVSPQTDCKAWQRRSSQIFQTRTPFCLAIGCGSTTLGCRQVGSRCEGSSKNNKNREEFKKNSRNLCNSLVQIIDEMRVNFRREMMREDVRKTNPIILITCKKVIYCNNFVKNITFCEKKRIFACLYRVNFTTKRILLYFPVTVKYPNTLASQYRAMYQNNGLISDFTLGVVLEFLCGYTTMLSLSLALAWLLTSVPLRTSSSY